MAGKRILIVGGVAGGASCAARARRLSEEAEIVIFERGKYVSFANCGLPYYVGDVMQDEGALLVASEDLFRDRFNIEVRTENEVLRIDREHRTVEVRDLREDRVYREEYDVLVLAPGASPIRPPLPGIESDGVFALRTIPDSRRIRAWIEARGAKRAVIVGAGFIGLEMAENLAERGMAIQLIDALPQVMAPLDPEMANIVRCHLEHRGIAVHLDDAVSGFEQTESSLAVKTESGARFDADMVILGIGVRPESGLAADAGLDLGDRGDIRVDAQMRTNDPAIWAVGDVVEKRDFVSGGPVQIPLAGPAKRQGRVAADAILGRESRFRAVQATSVCSILGKVVATTGVNEKTLRRLGMPCREVWVTCRVGQRAYYAARFLKQEGFRVRVLTGGYRTHLCVAGHPTCGT